MRVGEAVLGKKAPISPGGEIGAGEAGLGDDAQGAVLG